MRRVALTLHAHLPFYPPELDRPNPAGGVPYFGSYWLRENIIECYLPLLRNLKRLESVSENKLTLSFSPVLLEQLVNPKTKAAVVAELHRLIDRSEHDRRRFRGPMRQQADAYRTKFSDLLEFYLMVKRDIVGGVSCLTNAELMTTALTHTFLPLLKYHELACAFQLSEAARQARRRIGRRVKGFWFPEMGYTPYVGDVLSENFDYFLVSPAAIRGWDRNVYQTRGGVRYGVVDLGVTGRVWHPMPVCGEPSFGGNPLYREFFRWDDQSGLKYWSITGRHVPLEDKVPYSSADSARQVTEDVDACLRMLSELRSDRLLAIDAEFFGHHWYEGSDFLYLLLRRSGDYGIRFVSNSELITNPAREVPKAEPHESCWGGMDVWMGPGRVGEVRNDILARTEKATALFQKHREEGEPYKRQLLNRLLRELVLLQSSDYSFAIYTGRASQHYDAVTAHHRWAFDALAAEVAKTCSYCERKGFLPTLRKIARINCLFRDIDCNVFNGRGRADESDSKPESVVESGEKR